MQKDEILKLVVDGYDELAERFVSPFYETYENKPVDRGMLERFLATAREGLIVDVGCGIGPAARFVFEAGREVTGIDISQKALERARDLHKGISFEEMNLLDLRFDDASLGGVVSLFSIIHLTLEDIPKALAEFFRVLAPGSPLLVSVYKGETSGLLEPSEGYAVRMYSTLLMADQLVGLLERAGFEILNVEEREPYRYEFKGDRVFVLARRPTADEAADDAGDAGIPSIVSD